MTTEMTLHTGNPQKQGYQNIDIDRPNKGKLRIMTVSDSPWAPTGFGTNTRNIAALLYADGHHIGYGGCQNPAHLKWSTPWPLNQRKTWSHFENLPIMHPGQERYGEKSFPQWIAKYKPDVILAHLDFQMFKHMTDNKEPASVNFPIKKPDGSPFNRKEKMDMLSSAYKEVDKIKKNIYKLAVIIPYDGEPSIPAWKQQLDNIEFPVAMSKYGQQGLKKDFECDATYIPHGVDVDLFKPKSKPLYGGKEKPKNIFIVGCVARNQHRKNIPRLIKGFAQFVKKRNLSPKEVKLMLHMDWNDAMGWKIPEFSKQYGVEEYLMPALMGHLDSGDSITDEEMADLYNCMDVFVLPTGGEGFGIPTLEAMSCGVPICVTNYTTGYELVASKDPENDEVPMYPLGGHHNDANPNGRDHLEESDIYERGILIPYKDMWWDTPARAAPQRAIASENAICEALEYYYDNPEKKIAAGMAGRKHAIEHYSWNAIGKRWIDFFNDVTEKLK